MKTRRHASALRASSFLAAFVSLSLPSFAADQTVTGNLTVEGDSDLQGNTVSMGTRADSGVTPGLNWIYTDGVAPSVFFNTTRGAANWLWQDETGRIQLKLGSGEFVLLGLVGSDADR